MNIFRKSKTFHRYTPAARRAIFYAVQTTNMRNGLEITPADILLGTVRDKHADECPFQAAHEQREDLASRLNLPWIATPSEWPKLTSTGKRPLASSAKLVLAYAAQEASQSKRYWIDREDLQVGVHLADVAAGLAFSSIGYSIKETREFARIANQRWPEKKPSFKQRIENLKTPIAILLAFIVGLILANVINLVRSY
jgi:hypothetical protein